jgi:hypothetical protein
MFRRKVESEPAVISVGFWSELRSVGTTSVSSASNFDMKKKRIVFLLSVLISITAVCIYVGTSTEFALLKKSQVAVEVNGTRVSGDMFEGTRHAIVTRRDARKQHSYRLFFEVDTDASGDTGFVVDCPNWVAPGFPVLLETSSYPPCPIPSQEEGPYGRWRLVRSGQYLQFVTPSRETFKIRVR